MIRLFTSSAHPNRWVANSPETGWITFPAQPNGWELRQPAHGLDPVYLREVSLSLAAGTGLPDPHQPKHSRRRHYAEVA
jgi:hypothetical protein